eukprot:scaffold18941_cov40-Cyclotella_meneghiniana.AAC.1
MGGVKVLETLEVGFVSPAVPIVDSSVDLLEVDGDVEEIVPVNEVKVGDDVIIKSEPKLVAEAAVSEPVVEVVLKCEPIPVSDVPGSLGVYLYPNDNRSVPDDD